jgi:membrane protein YqaA with SNARE-associated domain
MNRMNNNKEPVSVPERIKKPAHWVKTLLFALQVSFVLGLLIIWLTSKGLQASKNLWVLFFYSFPSEFLIATVPHEPALLYYGKFYNALTVALVAIPSTLLTEMLNYSVFKYITDLPEDSGKKSRPKNHQILQQSPFPHHLGSWCHSDSLLSHSIPGRSGSLSFGEIHSGCFSLPVPQVYFSLLSWLQNPNS